MKIHKTFMLASLLLMVFSTEIFCQIPEKVLQVSGISGLLIFTDLNDVQKVEKDWMYHIMRVVQKDTFRIGTAIVKIVEDQKCYLNPFPVGQLKARVGDILMKDDIGTEQNLKTRHIEFWNDIQMKYKDDDKLAFVDGRIFKNCIIAFNDGSNKEMNHLIVKTNEGILVPEKFSNEYDLISIDKISSIKTSTGNHALLGALVGVAIGGAAVLMLHQDKVEIDTTYYYTESVNSFGNLIGWTKMMKVEKKDYRLPLMTRIGILGGGYLVGALVGYSFKGHWREVYSSKNSETKVSMKWDIVQPDPDAIGVNLRFRF